MAEPQSGNTSKAVNPLRLVQEACKTDDVASIEEAITLASSPGARFSKDQVIQRSLRGCVKRRSLKVLTYLLEQQGVNVNDVHPSTVLALDQPEDDPVGSPYELLNVLLAHGWDIDNRGPDRTSFPLLWYATSDPGLLDWCLEHGASVHIPGDTPPRDKNGVGAVPRMPLLEKAATDATVDSFEKLRAKGAPIGHRTLHQAVYHAAMSAPKEADQGRTSSNSGLAMVRHLVDVVGLDVNANCGYVGMPAGTPLYTIASRNDGRDTKELIWFLLDHGADPKKSLEENGSSTPLETAKASRNTRFIDAVETWKARQSEHTN